MLKFKEIGINLTVPQKVRKHAMVKRHDQLDKIYNIWSINHHT